MRSFSFFVLVLALSISSISALSGKRGFGASHSALAYPIGLVSSAFWYYDWGLYSNPLLEDSGLPFTPMYWNARCLYNPNQGPHCNISIARNSTHVLGFNEPDNIGQSNMSVAEAVAAWPLLVKSAHEIGAQVGACAMAGNPVTGTWLPEFMASVGDTVNFTTLHWYKGADAKHFMSDVTALIEKYNKPVWVTEFAAQYGSEAKQDPFKYSYEQIGNFMKEVLTFLEGNPMVHRYAWQNVVYGSSALWFPENNTLTPTGELYSTFSAHNLYRHQL